MTNNQTFYNELGRRIKEEREEKCLTQETLATRVSLTRTTITNIEKGRQQLLVHTLVEIAKALNVSPESLLPKPKPASIKEMIKMEPPQTQDWIRLFDLADRD